MFGTKKNDREAALRKLETIQETVDTLHLRITKMWGKLDSIETTVRQESGRVDRLADRLIQMALVNQGNAREAIAIGRVNAPPANQSRDDWGDPVEVDEEQWVPMP